MNCSNALLAGVAALMLAAVSMADREAARPVQTAAGQSTGGIPYSLGKKTAKGRAKPQTGLRDRLP